MRETKREICKFQARIIRIRTSILISRRKTRIRRRRRRKI